MADKKKSPKKSKETKTVDATKVAQKESIEFNKDKQGIAIITTIIPIVALIMFFIEKDDEFVRYTAAQYLILQAVLVVLTVVVVIPCLGQILFALGWLTYLAAAIYGVINLGQQKRVDLPVVSDLAIQLINSIKV